MGGHLFVCGCGRSFLGGHKGGVSALVPDYVSEAEEASLLTHVSTSKAAWRQASVVALTRWPLPDT